jgi:hypothetical protein
VNKELPVGENKCFYNVLRCPKTPFGSCKLVGSFETEDEAKRCKNEANNGIDHGTSIILIHKFEYEA